MLKAERTEGAIHRTNVIVFSSQYTKSTPRGAWGGTGVSAVNRWRRRVTRRMRILTRGHDIG